MHAMCLIRVNHEFVIRALGLRGLEEFEALAFSFTSAFYLQSGICGFQGFMDLGLWAALVLPLHLFTRVRKRGTLVATVKKYSSHA